MEPVKAKFFYGWLKCCYIVKKTSSDNIDSYVELWISWKGYTFIQGPDSKLDLRPAAPLEADADVVE